MTPEEQAREEARLRKYLDYEEPGGLMAISPEMLDMMFPDPDTEGMSPEQAEAAWVERDARIQAFLVARAGPWPESRPPFRTTKLARPPAPPEVPIS